MRTATEIETTALVLQELGYPGTLEDLRTSTAELTDEEFYALHDQGRYML
jgi:hypothetical protein